MQPETDSKPWRAATVLRHQHTPRSYVVQSEDGRNYRRNRQHLRVCPAPKTRDRSWTVIGEQSKPDRCQGKVLSSCTSCSAAGSTIPRAAFSASQREQWNPICDPERQTSSKAQQAWPLGQFKDCERHFFIKERWQLHFLLSLLLVIAIAKCQRVKISEAVATTDSFFALIGSHQRGTAVGLMNGENPCLKNPYCGGECKAVYQAPALHNTSGSCWLGTAHLPRHARGRWITNYQ